MPAHESPAECYFVEGNSRVRESGKTFLAKASSSLSIWTTSRTVMFSSTSGMGVRLDRSRVSTSAAPSLREWKARGNKGIRQLVGHEFNPIAVVALRSTVVDRSSGCSSNALKYSSSSCCSITAEIASSGEQTIDTDEAYQVTNSTARF